VATQTPNSDRVEKWQRAVREARKAMRHYMQYRLVAIQNYIGRYYSEKGAKEECPLNMTYSAVTSIVPLLVSRNPRAQCRAKAESQLYAARMLRKDLDEWCDEADFEAEMRLAVLQALFGFGIVSCGSEPKTQVGDPSERLFAERVYAEAVSAADYIIDPRAKRRRDAEFEGERYQASLAWVQESGFFENADALKPVERKQDEQEGKRYPEADALSPEVELVNLWVPSDGAIYTLPVEGQGSRVLRTTEWGGDERGPYEMLGFADAPDDLLPVPPVQAWLDLHILVNNAARKMGKRIEKGKRVIGYAAGAEQDAERIRKASDLEAIRMDNPEAVKEYDFGMDVAGLQGTINYLISHFSRQSGNTDLLGGLGSSTPTLGQEQMLWESAGGRIKDMRNQIYSFTQRVLQKAGWFLWTDPMRATKFLEQLPGLGISRETTFGPEDRQGDLSDIEIGVEPYSMESPSPMQVAEKVTAWVERYVLPTAHLAAAQGRQLDAEALVRFMADKFGITEAEVADLYKPGVPMELAPIQQAAPMNRPKAPSQRVTRSPGSQQAAPTPEPAGVGA